MSKCKETTETVPGHEPHSCIDSDEHAEPFHECQCGHRWPGVGSTLAKMESGGQ